MAGLEPMTALPESNTYAAALRFTVQPTSHERAVPDPYASDPRNAACANKDQTADGKDQAADC
jgi:hypothetical protein